MPEKLIAELCSPTLTAVKCASLINCEYETKQKLNDDILHMDKRLSKKGIHMMVLSYPGKNHALIYMFRPKLLQEALDVPDTRELMKEMGYSDHRIGCCLNVLRNKFVSSHQFPHEIGCFLGYPSEDVIGFMKNEKCVYHGMWKVYGNVEEAKKKFALYEHVTQRCTALFQSGMPLEEIAVA